MQQQNNGHIQLVKYRFGKHQLSAEDTLAKQVYIIKSHPKVIPVDVNIQWLLKQGWNPALDRIRYSTDQLFIRRFDPSAGHDFCIVVQMMPCTHPSATTTSNNPSGNSSFIQTGASGGPGVNNGSVQICVYGNDEVKTELYFRGMFTGNHLDVMMEEMNVSMRGWVDTPHDLLFYCGSVHAAFGLWGSMLVDMQLNGFGGNGNGCDTNCSDQVLLDNIGGR